MKITINYIKNALNTPLTNREIQSFMYGNRPAFEVKLRSAILSMSDYYSYVLNTRSKSKIASAIRVSVQGAHSVDDVVRISERIYGVY